MGLSDLKNTVGKIIIHKEQMQRDISLLKQAAGEFRTASEPCKRGIDSSRWAGESADVFKESYASFAKSIDNQANECERIAQKMIEVIDMFEQAERDIQAQIKNLLGGNG